MQHLFMIKTIHKITKIGHNLRDLSIIYHQLMNYSSFNELSVLDVAEIV